MILSHRFTRRYTLLGGLWCAEEQPPMFQYLRPILERVKALETEGPKGKLYIVHNVITLCLHRGPSGH